MYIKLLSRAFEGADMLPTRMPGFLPICEVLCFTSLSFQLSEKKFQIVLQIRLFDSLCLSAQQPERAHTLQGLAEGRSNLYFLINRALETNPL